MLTYIAVMSYFVITSGLFSATKESTATEKHIATVNIYGSIDTNTDSSAKNIIKALNKAFKNEQSEMVVLQINSPGGRPVQAAYIHDEIVRLKKQYNKPVVSIIEDSGASAAYLIAVATDTIYANQSSIVGSIGVRMDGFNYKKIMDTIGIKNTTLTAGNNKDLLSPFKEVNPEGVKHISHLLENVHSHFIKFVVDGRGDRLAIKDNQELFSGLFWTGEEAKKLGLIDGFESIYDIKRITEMELVVNYNNKKNFMEQIMGDLGASISSSLVGSIDQALLTKGVTLR
jgi:protease-4